MEKEFKDYIVAITGASSGIGKATALAFAKEGAKVAIADIQKEGGEETLKFLEEAGAEAFFTILDVTEADKVEEWIRNIVKKWGSLDIGLNNAGIDGIERKTHLYPEDDFKKVIDININGVWYGMRSMISVMLESGKGGVIINMASIAGLLGLYGHAPYTASKHAVIGLTKTAAIEYAKKGIRINAICPSFIETPMVFNAASKPGQLEQLAHINPMKRLGKPEEIAETVLFLCSKRASYVNAHSLVVDGGLSIL